jgi:hypothetical protein
MRLAVNAACVGEMRKVYKIFARKLERKGPLVRAKRIWQNNIKMDVREICWYILEWMYVGEDRDLWLGVVNTVMNLPVS